jgi:bifunctional enzyme CysN/CysC/sulfate adenylyltransferase subunit 1
MASPRSSAGCSTTRKSIMEDQLEALGALRRHHRRRPDQPRQPDRRTLRPSASRASPSMSPTATSPRPRRKFIVADTPGHVQYTRNMVTGASTANLSIVLVDARQGVIEQSRRHTYLASLLRIPHLVIAVNKMDLVGWSRSRASTRSATTFEKLPAAPRHQGREVHPLERPQRRQRGGSLHAHTVVFRARRCSAISRACTSPATGTSRASASRCSWVESSQQPDRSPAPRLPRLSGQIASGIVRVGQRVMVLPSGLGAPSQKIWTYDGHSRRGLLPPERRPCNWRTIWMSAGAT